MEAEAMKELSQKSLLTAAEHVRRAIDSYLDGLLRN